MMQSREQPEPFSRPTLPPRPHAVRRRGVFVPLSRSRREAIRTNLWAVPAFMVILIIGLFAITYAVDRRAAAGGLALPSWMGFGVRMSCARS